MQGSCVCAVRACSPAHARQSLHLLLLLQLQNAAAAPSGAGALHKEELLPLPPSPSGSRVAGQLASLSVRSSADERELALPDLPALELDLGALWGGDGGAPF